MLGFCRAVVGIVFAVSFAGKARDTSTFRETISRFGLIPAPASGAAVAAIMAGEIAVALAMALGGRFLMAGFVGAVLLLVVFSAALAAVLKRRIDTSCNCFGASEKPITPYDIWRNAGFLCCALCGCCGALTAPNAGAAQLGLAEYGLAAVGAAVFVAISSQLGEIVQLFRSG
jgi:hypothetical protein